MLRQIIACNQKIERLRKYELTMEKTYMWNRLLQRERELSVPCIYSEQDKK